jgi:hypothetical protein
MNENDKAYIGCFLDTDGTITLINQINKGKLYFKPKLIFYNGEEWDILYYIKSLCNSKGNMTKAHYKYNGQLGNSFRHEIIGYKPVERILKDVYPYIHLKRKKKIAELLFEFFELHHYYRKSQHPYTRKGEKYEYPKRMFEIQEEISLLNRAKKFGGKGCKGIK